MGGEERTCFACLRGCKQICYVICSTIFFHSEVSNFKLETHFHVVVEVYYLFFNCDLGGAATFWGIGTEKQNVWLLRIEKAITFVFYIELRSRTMTGCLIQLFQK